MKNALCTVFVLTLVCCALSVAAPPSYAYVDPGSGSLVIQLLLGGLASVAVLLKHYWQRIAALFGRPPTKPSNSAGEIESDAGEL